MRYQIKQRLMSFAGRFDIADEAGEPILRVVGKLVSLRRQLTIESLDGRELAHLRQRLLTFLPRYEITRDGAPLAEVVREWTLIKPRFTVRVAGGDDLTVTGSFWEHRYTIEGGGRRVAEVSQAVWSLRDTYGVEVFEPEQDALVLAVVIAIDAINASRRGAAAAGV